MSHLRAAVYCRPSCPTGHADDLIASLRGVAASRGWHVVTSVADQPTDPESVRSAHPALDGVLRDTNFDVLVVRSLSHLASTIPELISVVNELRTRGTALMACDDGIDTTTEAGKSAFAAFAALAQFGRTMIRERSRISLDRARRNGTRLGRPSNMNPGVRAAIIALHERGVSVRRIAGQLRVGHATICKALQAETTHPAPKGSQTSRNGIRTPLRPLERAGNRVPA